MNYFFTFLTLLFVYLKLTDVIAWSWILVLSPVLVTTGIAVTAAIIALITAGRKIKELK